VPNVNVTYAEMQSAARQLQIHARLYDPDLVSRAGLMPVMALAQRAGLAGLAGDNGRIGHRCGVNPHLKVPGIMAGMIGGADWARR
jgi:hypothetical protein